MALKIYEVGGFVYQYEEGEQPAGAVERKPKARTVANKARTVANAGRKPEAKALEDMTVRDLIAICAEERIETPRKPNKAQVIAAIRAARGE